MSEYKLGTQAFALVRMLDSSGTPVTGIVYSAVTATLVYSDGTTATISPSGGTDWVEVTTGAFSGMGVYRLKITAGNMTVNGQWAIAVAVSGAETAIIAWGDIVANLESDVYTATSTIISLALQNSVLETVTADSAGRMLTGRRRCYDSSAHATLNDGATGLLFTNNIVVTYNSYGMPTAYTETR